MLLAFCAAQVLAQIPITPGGLGFVEAGLTGMLTLVGVSAGAAVLATDGVFSMDGDVAPLRELAIVARVQQAMLYVDDAHGVGVLGPDGRGSVADARLDIDAVPLQLVTLGKAGIKTLDDLADLATDELVQKKRPEPRRRAEGAASSQRQEDKGGVLADYGLTDEHGNEIIMAARAHWFEDDNTATSSKEDAVAESEQ